METHEIYDCETHEVYDCGNTMCIIINVHEAHISRHVYDYGNTSIIGASHEVCLHTGL